MAADTVQELFQWISDDDKNLIWKMLVRVSHHFRTFEFDSYNIWMVEA
jgi:hypothetical protein